MTAVNQTKPQGVTEHLRDHLTDGCWHDDCEFCLRRRVHGGTGIRCPETITPNDLTYQCERSEGHDGEHRDWRVSWTQSTVVKRA